MGLEFLSRTKRTITKHIDAKRVALATPSLFTTTPTSTPRCSIASVAGNVNLTNGEVLILEARNGSVKLRRGIADVGDLDNPSCDTIAAIEKSGGVANGVVQRVHKISKKVEVSLC